MLDRTDGGEVSEELLDELAGEASEPDASPAGAPAPDSAAGEYTSRLLVAEWLTDEGVSFRVKPELDSRKRTVYVLKVCPFDESHVDPDACIMQEPGGKLSAHCFHDGCKGRGWRAFKDKIGAPGRQHYDPPLPARSRKRSGKKKSKKSRKDAPAASSGIPTPDTPAGPSPESPSSADTATQGPRLPSIQGNQRQLRDVTDAAQIALVAANDPPKVFQRGGLLTRLRIREESGAPFLEPLNDAALRGVLSRAADWYKVRDTQEGEVMEDDAPPLEVVKDLANLPSWDGIPAIDGVVECPVFDRDGVLVATPGFHPRARLWYHPAPGLIVPPVPERPTAEDVCWARELLLTGLLGDFPFVDVASKAHALAALLLPFVRALVDGPTPLHLLDAPTEGTGKTLLASVIGLVPTGRVTEATGEGNCDEEWRKRLTALLSEAPTFILLDNLKRVLDSSSLAAVLTTRVWKDRILGMTKTASLPNIAVWLASGNNTGLSREMMRRTVWTRLDSGLDNPCDRTEFRHKNLLVWATANRGALVGAALTLCQAWVAAGRPAGTQTLGMFESWAQTLGGIFDVAGVPGLLANARKFRTTSTDQVSDWRAFVASWWQEFGEGLVGVDQLFMLAQRDKLLDGVLGDKGERSQRIRLGRALGKASDRVYGNYRLARAEEDHKQRQQYRLCAAITPAEDGKPSTSPKEPSDLQEWSA